MYKESLKEGRLMLTTPDFDFNLPGENKDWSNDEGSDLSLQSVENLLQVDLLGNYNGGDPFGGLIASNTRHHVPDGHLYNTLPSLESSFITELGARVIRTSCAENASSCSYCARAFKSQAGLR